MMKKFLVLSLALSLLAGAAAHSYEVSTHARISEAAVDQSVLARQYLERELGLSLLSRLRSQDGQVFNARGWIVEGSIREDDTISGVLARYRNHFYDPVYDRGLTGRLPVLGTSLSVGKRSFEWGLEDTDGINGQDFSWRDARRYFLGALTAEMPAERESQLARTFLALGHLVHLIQDMGSPEHTRNDWHGGVIPPTYPFGVPSLFEKHVDTVREKFRYDGYPAPAFFALRWFWKSGDAKGFAEFTNRSFVTKSTNFTRTVEGNSGRDDFGNLYPQPALQPARRSDVDIRELDDDDARRAGLSGTLTFFGNTVSDFLTGEVFDNERLTSYSLFDRYLAAQGATEIFTINRYNVEAAASILLPRAAGYSAGLLDYFFRGRLDGDLMPDPSGPDLIRFVGTNASAEAMDGGVLELHGDAADGRRVRLAPVDTDLAVAAEPGGTVRSARFQSPPAIERFMAVYRGQMGNETAAASPAAPNASPGAVVGKALGGVRVEHLLSANGRWNIRTPDGIFPLPILTTDVQELVWGDADNLLVGRTALASGAPNEFVLFRLDRQRGVPTVPLTAGGVVRLVDPAPARVAFPVGLPIGTVNLTHTLRFRQHLPAVLHEVQISGALIDPATEAWELVLPLAASEDRAVTRTHILRLDLDKLNNSRAEPHSWRLRQIGATTDGRILALIISTLRLRNDFEAFATQQYASVCGGWPCPRQAGPPILLPVRFPTSGFDSTLAVLVDLSNQQVVASTAPDVMRLTHTTSHVAFGQQLATPFVNAFPRVREVRRQSVDGGAPTFVQFDDNVLRNCTLSPSGASVDLGTFQATLGTLEAGLGQYRAEIEAAVGAPPSPTRTQNTVALCIDAFHNRPPDFTLPTFTVAVDNHAPTPDRLGDGLRARTDEPRLTLLIPKGSSATAQHVVRWDPATPAASLRATIQESGLQTLASASERRAVLATASGLAVATLEDGASSVLFPMDSTTATGFRALEPGFVYRVDDGKFYRTFPLLEQTALPRVLAPTPVTAGDYHAVRLD